MLVLYLEIICSTVGHRRKRASRYFFVPQIGVDYGLNWPLNGRSLSLCLSPSLTGVWVRAHRKTHSAVSRSVASHSPGHDRRLLLRLRRRSWSVWRSDRYWWAFASAARERTIKVNIMEDVRLWGRLVWLRIRVCGGKYRCRHGVRLSVCLFEGQGDLLIWN